MTTKKIVINILLLAGYYCSNAGACQPNAAACQDSKPAISSSTSDNQEYQAAAAQPPLKKQKTDSACTDLQPQVLLPKAYFNDQIQPVIRDLMLKEEGKIWAAMYQVTSGTLLSWWAMRKYIQEHEKALQKKDIDALMGAEKLKTSPKKDILIVDKVRRTNPENMLLLQDFAQKGIQVLMRTKDHIPVNDMQQMHNKFIIFFHNNSDVGKLVITGSFNITNQAAKYNWENIIILDDPAVVAQFIAEHKHIKQFCEPISPPSHGQKLSCASYSAKRT